MNFVKCPCCAGHETISAEAAAELAMMIFNRLDGFGESPVVTELNNIRNAILNMAERRSKCENCGNEIDPDYCHCGIAMTEHSWGDGHSPIPAGCDCGRAIDPLLT